MGKATFRIWRGEGQPQGDDTTAPNVGSFTNYTTEVSEGMVAIPKQDLRRAAVVDAFHLLPARSENAFMLPATHPPLQARIERLQRLETALQHARS